MHRRTAALLIGVLAAVCLGLVLSVVSPFTTSAPHAANPSGERFSVGDADAFSATGRITVAGETRLAFDGAVTADGRWYHRLVERDVVSEEYRLSDGPVYRRLTVEEGAAAEQRRTRFAEDERATLLRESRNGGCVTFVTRHNTTRASEPVSGTASVFVNNLWVAAYEPAGTDPSGTTTYRPQPGWYEGRVTYRITGASGTVHADSESAVVTRANVSWQVTRVGTYAQYALSEVLGDGSTAQRTTFRFDPTAPDLERPRWASDGGGNATGVPGAC